MNVRRTLVSCLLFVAVAFIAGVNRAGAETYINVRVPISDVVENPCTGDVLMYSGMGHALVLWHQKDDHVVLKSHFQPQNVKAVVISGPNVGATYTGTGVDQEQGVFTKNTQSITQISRFDFHGKGRAPNFKMHTTVHITYANGEVRVEFGKSTITCK